MNNFCGNDCLWLLLLLFCCGGNKCGCNVESILWIYLLLCCCGGGCGCPCKDAGPNFGFGCK